MRHHYIITLHPSVDEHSVASDYESMGGEVTHIYGVALNGFSAYLPNNLIEYASSDDRVKFVEHDSEPTLDAVQHEAPWFLDGTSWSGEDGLYNGLYEYTEDAEGVKIYIVDSGIRLTHEEFEGRAVHGFGSITPIASHGTAVASSAAGKTYGTAKKATIVNVEASQSWSDFVAGVEWIIANHTGLGVVNMSLGGGTEAAATAVSNLVATGITVICSAGNDISILPSNRVPSNVPGVLPVGGSTSAGLAIPGFAQDESIKIFAPGALVETATHTSDTAFSVNVNGTSFSAPYTAGVAAMILAANPTFTGEQVINKILELSIKNEIGEAKNGATGNLLNSSSIGGTVTSDWSEPVSIIVEEATGDSPTADAGPQQVVEYGTLVTLDASNSVDYENVQWEQIAGETITLDDTNSIAPSFTAPYTRQQLRFRLTAINSNGTDFDEVIIGTAGVTIRTREQWGADENLITYTPTYAAVQTLTLHHTGDARATISSDYDVAMRNMLNAHVNNRGWSDLGYQFVIAPDGTIYEGRASGNNGDPGHNPDTDEHVVGSHVGGWNSGNLGISLMGNFTEEWAPSEQYKALERLLVDLCNRHGLDPEGTVDYVNPVTYDFSTQPTITEHNAWPGTATDCAGTYFRSRHPRVRYHVAVRQGKYTTPDKATLAGMTPGPNSHRVGPYRVADGGLVTIGMDEDALNWMLAVRSDDNGLTWYDQATYRKGNSPVAALAVVYTESNDTMHTVFQDEGGWVIWKPYRPGDDTWPAGLTLDSTPGANVNFAVDIAARADNHVYVAYKAADNRIRGMGRNATDATWTASASLDAGAGHQYELGAVTYDADSNLCFLTYRHQTTGMVRGIAINENFTATAPSVAILEGHTSAGAWKAMPIEGFPIIYGLIRRPDNILSLVMFDATAPIDASSIYEFPEPYSTNPVTKTAMGIVFDSSESFMSLGVNSVYISNGVYRERRLENPEDDTIAFIDIPGADRVSLGPPEELDIHSLVVDEGGGWAYVSIPKGVTPDGPTDIDVSISVDHTLGLDIEASAQEHIAANVSFDHTTEAIIETLAYEYAEVAVVLDHTVDVSIETVVVEGASVSVDISINHTTAIDIATLSYEYASTDVEFAHTTDISLEVLASEFVESSVSFYTVASVEFTYAVEMLLVPPANFTVNFMDYETMALSWSAVEPAEAYVIERQVDRDGWMPDKRFTIATTSTTDTVEPGENYRYRIQSVRSL